MPLLTYCGGPLDGREASVEGKSDVEIPLYGNGYEKRATGFLRYRRDGQELVFLSGPTPGQEVLAETSDSGDDSDQEVQHARSDRELVLVDQRREVQLVLRPVRDT